MSHIESRELLFYADGEVTPTRAGEIREHVKTCNRCADILAAHREVIEALGEGEESFEEVDLVPGVMAAIESEAPSGTLVVARAGFWRRNVRGFALGVAASVAVLLVVPEGGFQGEQRSEEFRVKSTPVSSKGDLVGISAYRLGSKGAPVYLGESMKADEPLLFAYANAGKRPYEFMMIFGVDGAGAAHWYYPAYVKEGEEPGSIRIKGGQTGVELGEAIRHGLSPGRLTIYGVFSRAPLRVGALEALVMRRVKNGVFKPGVPLDFSSLGQVEVHRLETRVK